MATEVPTRHCRYEVLFPLASGGMAEVFVAHLVGEGDFRKLVALKKMHTHLAKDESFVRMFLDEAQLAANISSAHVVPTLDLGKDDDGALYIVMEMVVGLSLRKLMKLRQKDGFPIALGAEISAQAALGLHDAHEATTTDGAPLDIVHRDVSPENILVGVDGRVRLSDFGVARALKRKSTTDDGMLKGKFAYCSPEQAEGSAMDRRSDVFALGICAWEMFAGERLFKSESPLATLRQVVEEPTERLDALVRDVPSELASAVDVALHKRPEDRFESADRFARVLRAATGHLAPVERRDIAMFVKQLGGDSLQRLRRRIRNAAEEPPASSRKPEQKTATIQLRAPQAHVLDAGRPAPASLPPTRVEGLSGSEASTVDKTDFASVSAVLPLRSRRVAIAVGGALAAAAVIFMLTRGGADGASAPAPPSAASQVVEPAPAATAPASQASRASDPDSASDPAAATSSARAPTAPPPRTPPRRAAVHPASEVPHAAPPASAAPSAPAPPPPPAKPKGEVLDVDDFGKMSR